jgi:hypothetical protein
MASVRDAKSIAQPIDFIGRCPQGDQSTPIHTPTARRVGHRHRWMHPPGGSVTGARDGSLMVGEMAAARPPVAARGPGGPALCPWRLPPRARPPVASGLVQGARSSAPPRSRRSPPPPRPNRRAPGRPAGTAGGAGDGQSRETRPLPASRAAVSATTSGGHAAFRASVTARPSARSRIARVCGQGAGDGLRAGKVKVAPMTYHAGSAFASMPRRPMPRS